MKTIRLHGASLDGANALLVTVEARFVGSPKNPESGGSTEIHLTGLPDSILRESRGRLSCVLSAIGMWLDPGRLYLNLVPAAAKKSGEALDLALVLAAAAACGHLTRTQVAETLFLGEVGIDGRLHAVPGGLACAVAARSAGITRVIAAETTAAEAAALGDVHAFAAGHVRQVLEHLTNGDARSSILPRMEPPPLDPSAARDPARLDEVRGQDEAKLALQIAAAGGHGILFIGPPGAGKSMLARRLIDLLPSMDIDERIDVTSILSATGRWPKGLASRRPFRAPHHTTSFAGLIGGGSPIAPGEITLAHRGVLFLDELPEFSREALEGLRQPLEEGLVHLARASHRRTLPADFQLTAAMNPCPCGYEGHPRIPCMCSPGAVRRYRQRISGPLLDRIDLRVSLQPAGFGVLVGGPDNAATERTPAAAPGAVPGPLPGIELAEGIQKARAIARERNTSLVGVQAGADGNATMIGPGSAPTSGLNATLDASAIDAVAPLDIGALDILEHAATKWRLSARGVQSVRRVARTIADLRGSEAVDEEALMTAIGLRAPLVTGS